MQEQNGAYIEPPPLPPKEQPKEIPRGMVKITHNNGQPVRHYEISKKERRQMKREDRKARKAIRKLLK